MGNSTARRCVYRAKFQQTWRKYGDQNPRPKLDEIKYRVFGCSSELSKGTNHLDSLTHISSVSDCMLRRSEVKYMCVRQPVASGAPIVLRLWKTFDET